MTTQPPQMPYDEELGLHHLALIRETRATPQARGLLGRIRAMGLVIDDLRGAYKKRQNDLYGQIQQAEYHFSRALKLAPTKEAEAPDHANHALEHLAKAKALINASLLAFAITLALATDQDARRLKRAKPYRIRIEQTAA